MTVINPFEEPQLPKIKITPIPDGESLLWQCNGCQGQNELLKSEISENKAYMCGNCGKAWVLGIIPDDMRYWLRDDKVENIDKRPKIRKW